MKSHIFFTAAGAYIVSLFLILPAYADNVIVEASDSENSITTGDFLKMLRKAKPLSGPTGRQNMRFDTSVSGTTIVSPGSDGSSSKSYFPRTAGARAWGSSGIPYTSAPVMFKVRKDKHYRDPGFLSYTYPYSWKISF